MKLRTKGLLMMLGLLVSSCSLLPHQPAALHDLGYSHSASLTESASPTTSSPVSVEAPKWLTDNRIHYRFLYSSPTQVRSYTLDRWIAPPPELFEQLLNNSGKKWFNPVNIRLHVFEQQFDSINKASVVMRFTASVITESNQSQNNRFQQDFNLHLSCPTPDAKGAVSAFNILARQSIDMIQAWLLKAR